MAVLDITKTCGGDAPPAPPAPPAADHPAPLVVDIAPAGSTALLGLMPAPSTPIDSVEFVDAAARAGRLLPAAAYDALVHFVDHSHTSGALVLRGVPIGDVPPTPASPRSVSGKDRTSEFVLLTIARVLGQPVGYLPEHGGELVQNLVPTKAAAATQTSTSSAVTLDFHTEAAFHPHKPRFLVLLCMRADPARQARTTLCSIDAALTSVAETLREVLWQPRFRTGVDESYTNGRTGRLGPPMPVLSGSRARPMMTFDADLMVGIDDEATRALGALRAAVHIHHLGVALDAGDLLIVDNHVAVHGRTPFTARFDGSDRWLQRSFVVADLAASAGERGGGSGRVITTQFD